MQYFGVPKCPYCKKRVNLIRTWSLKRQGEYRCPRCGGISNIFLSPLIYVFALLAVFSAGAVYFFHKFILDDIGLTTCFQVFLPFAVFFLLSLFMVYLAKPVIKRVSREETGKKKQNRNSGENRRAGSGHTGPIYADSEEYLPHNDYRTGPFPQERPVNAPAPQAVRENAQPTAVMPSPAAQRRQAAQNTAAQSAGRRSPVSQNSQIHSRVASGAREGTSTGYGPRMASPTGQRPAVSPSEGNRTVSRAAQQSGAYPTAQRPAVSPSEGNRTVSRAAQQSGAYPTAQRPAVSQNEGNRAVSRAAQQSGAYPTAQRPAVSPSEGNRAVSRVAQQSGAYPTAQRPAVSPNEGNRTVSRAAQQPTAPITPRRDSAYSQRPSTQEPRRASHVVSSVEIPSVSDDFFAKYDDPDYVERRLKELQNKENQNS